MAEPFRFRAVDPDSKKPESRTRAFLRTRLGKLVFGAILTLGLLAAALGAWIASGNPLPGWLRPDIPTSFADLSPESFGLLFILMLIGFGALAAAILIVSAIRRAMDPTFSAPYRTYVLFTLVAALISGYTTTYGVIIEFLDPSQGFIRYRIFPVIVFLYAFLFVYLTWSWTFDLVIRSEPRRRAMIALLIPLLAAPPIFAVSTTTSALGLAGPRILERRLLGWLDEYSDALGDLSAYVRETESAALSLETFAGRMDQLSAQEADTGAITGYAGRGAVVAQLSVAADDLEAGAQLIRRETEARETSVEAMADQIEDTRDDILDGAFFETPAGEPLPVRDWQDKVQAQERALRREWEDTASRAYVRAALGQLSMLDALIMRGGVSDSATVADAQRQAQGQVSAYLANGQQIVQDELERAIEEEAPRPPDIAYQSPLLVLFQSWEQAILPWVIAIAVDFGPWVWIALAAVAGYDRRRSRARYAQPEGHHWEDEYDPPARRTARVIDVDEERPRLDRR